MRSKAGLSQSTKYVIASRSGGRTGQGDGWGRSVTDLLAFIRLPNRITHTRAR
jgi:hypothetical protein